MYFIDAFPVQLIAKQLFFICLFEAIKCISHAYQFPPKHLFWVLFPTSGVIGGISRFKQLVVAQ